MAVSKKAPGGTVIRDANGDLYFIRDEVLPAFKMQRDAASRMKKLVDQGKSGPLRLADTSPLSYVSGDLVQMQNKSTDKAIAVPELLTRQGAVRSTIMCPWFC